MSKIKRPAPSEQAAIFDAAVPLLTLPFNGIALPFRIRELTQAQILSLGNISLIDSFHSKLEKAKTPTVNEMTEYAERQHNICRLAMVSPTYDEVIAAISPGFDFAALEATLKEIRLLFDAMRPGKQKDDLRLRYNGMELQYKFILPGDFIGAVLDFCLDIGKSKIKEVSRGMLLQAAVLASRGHDNPSDHIDTVLMKPHHVQDFNSRAWQEFDKEQEKPKKKGA